MNPGRYPLRVLQNRLGQVPRPSWVTYLVSNRCNAQCGMCDSWKMKRGLEMTVGEVREVFGKLGSLDVVRLTGGEPFLRTDLLQIAEAVMSASDPAVLHVTTNGSFPDRVLAFATDFTRPRRLRVMVSLDGLPATHDANRGKKVSFENALATVRGLAALKPNGLRVTVNHTIISRQSLADAGALRRLFGGLGVDVHWVLAYANSAMYSLSRRGSCAEDLAGSRDYLLHPALDRAESQRFVDRELEQLGEIDEFVTRLAKRYYMRGLSERLGEHPPPRLQPKCVALRSHLRLMPDGSVVVCQFNTAAVGSLLGQSLEQLWSSPRALDHRRWVDACNGCWAECEVLPNAIYSGDIFSCFVRGCRASQPEAHRNS